MGASAAVVDFGQVSPAQLLLGGQQLSLGQALTSPSGHVIFAMPGDHNLCLYSSPNASWCAPNVQDGAGTLVTMQTDGNLCAYVSPGSGALWCSSTAGHPGAYLAVQENGKATIFDGVTVLWSVP